MRSPVTALAIVLLAIEGAWMVGHWGGEVVTLGVVQGVAALAPWIAAFACFGRALDERGRIALAWELLAYGCIAWGLGQAWRALDLLVLQADLLPSDRAVAFPSPADAGAVGFFVLVVVGLISLPSKLWTRSARLRVTVDGLMLALALFALAWTILRRQALAEGPHLDSVLALGYPAAGVVLLALAVLVGAYAAPHERARQIGLLLAIDVLALGDFAFWAVELQGADQTGAVALLWPAGFLALATVAAWPGRPTAELQWAIAPPSAAVRALPIVAVALAAAVLAIAWSPLDAIAVPTACAALALAPVRELAWRYERRHWEPESDPVA